MSLDEPERTKANVVQHDIRDDRKLHEKKIPILLKKDSGSSTPEFGDTPAVVHVYNEMTVWFLD